MKVIIDKEKCIGCGSCVAVCPGVFEMTADGKAELVAGADLEANKEKITEAVAICPTEAITQE